MTVEPPAAAPWVVRPRPALELSPRSLVTIVLASLIGAAAYLWPFFAANPDASATAFNAHSSDATLLMLVVLPLLLMVIGAQVAEQNIDARAIALLGVLAAISAVLRIPGGGVSGFSPMFFLVVLAGAVFGSGFGFVLGGLAMALSAIITAGVGPWLPFQIFALAWVGAGAGVVGCLGGPVRTSRVSWRLVAALCAYGVVVGFAFGAIMNLWFWPFATGPGSVGAYRADASLRENVAAYARFYVATSLGWDMMRAVGNVVMTVAIGPPILRTLGRAAARAQFS